jgi:hypothetical protein
MNIAGLSKAKVLAALYNASKPQGLGFLHYDPRLITEAEAQALLDEGQTYFDYVHGRVMKVSLSGDELSTRLYNRDNGENAAETVIANLKAGEEVTK